MTVLVGILCKDGVVLGSDSAATFGSNGQPTIGQQSVQKVAVIEEKIVYASTGAVGIAQLIIDSIKTGWKERAFNGIKTPEQMMDALGKRIGSLVGPYLQTAQLQRHITGEANASLCKSLIAIPVNHIFCLFQFDCGGAPEMATAQLPFVALGSGQGIADPFLALLKRLLWPDCEPTLAEGRLAAVWTIDHVRQTNAGGVGGDIQLATLTNANQNVRLVEKAEIEEHLQAIGAAEQALAARIKGHPEIAVQSASPDFGA